jgi:glycosyltransferase involved in cell wall biosynthesis
MLKRLLIITTLPQRQQLLGDLLHYFKTTRQPFFLLAKSRRLLQRAAFEHWSFAKSSLLIVGPFIFTMLLPITWLAFGLTFLFRLWRLEVDTVLLFSWPEKIAFSPIIYLFKKRLIWVEYPDSNLPATSRIINFFYKRFGKKAEIIVFGNKPAENLRSLINNERISVILPAAPAKHLEQHSIFKTLADKTPRSRFVIGSVLYGLPKDQAERLLSAMSIAQVVCPLIELVIIGSGNNRQQIQWLARKMGLERRVWLAGPTIDFSRWVSHLDVYIMANKKPNLEDAAWAIKAMSTGLPVLAPQVAWLEDIINTKTGVRLDVTNPEVIARQLISLEQSPDLRHKLGQEAKTLANKLSFENFSESFVKLLS